MHQKNYTNLYASYPVTASSSALLQQFSREVIQILQQYSKGVIPAIHVPSHYHLTAQYIGYCNDIEACIASVLQKKKNHGEYIECDGIWTLQSNVTKNHIIYTKPVDVVPFQGLDHNLEDIHDEKMKTILYDDYTTSGIPHITLADINNITDTNFWLRFWMHGLLHIMDARSELGEGESSIPIHIDTSKVQIWGRENGGEKKLIVEV